MSNWVDVDIDIFEEKDAIIENFTIKELKEEIERRENLGIEEDDEVVSHIMYKSFNIDLDEFNDEVLNNASDSDVIDELENRGYVVFKNRFIDVGLSRDSLTSMLGLREWATNEQILEELKIVIN